ncbi:MAG: universal stress protein, partial [Candidatus Acidiferrales bacterium]
RPPLRLTGRRIMLPIRRANSRQPKKRTVQIKLILCPIDFSEFSARAYRYALSLAEHYHAKLVALHVVEIWRHPSASFSTTADLYQKFRQAFLENGGLQLQEFVKEHASPEIQRELVVQEGTAADEILSCARTHRADLIAMGTHGRRGFDRLMLGSVTDRVMRAASCPVLVVSSRSRDAAVAATERHPHRLDRILLCTDFSENSERALNYAVSVAEEYSAEITLLNVLEHAPAPAEQKSAIAAAQKQLDKLISPEQHKSLKIKTAMRVGKAYEQIVKLAEEAQSDLLVVGVHGRGALDAAIFGSTTYRVMQLGSCPVLAVPA